MTLPRGLVGRRVALGLGAGARGLAHRPGAGAARPGCGSRRNRREVMVARSERVAEWLGLPWLLDAAFRAPVDRLGPRRSPGSTTARSTRAPARPAGSPAGASPALARGDDRAVDAGVRGTVAFGAWLARMGDRFGEAAADGLPSGAGALAAMSGRDLRGLQTGALAPLLRHPRRGPRSLAALLLAGF